MTNNSNPAPANQREKGELPFEHATLKVQDSGATSGNSAANDATAATVAMSEVNRHRAEFSAGGRRPVVNVMTRQERLQALEAHLAKPFGNVTELMLVDAINRLATGEKPFVLVESLLVQRAADPKRLDRHRVGMLLAAAVRYGVIQAKDQRTGCSGSYCVTALGRRYLSQAKSMRIGLWELNPESNIERMCAIIQLEGSDTFDQMLLHSASSRDTVHGEVDRRRQIESHPFESARQSQIHPLWASLT